MDYYNNIINKINEILDEKIIFNNNEYEELKKNIYESIKEYIFINIEEIIMTNIHLIPIDLTFFISIKFIILIKFST